MRVVQWETNLIKLDHAHTTPMSSSSEESSEVCFVGEVLRLSDAAASFEFSLSTPNAWGRSTSCNREVEVDIAVIVIHVCDGGGRKERCVSMTRTLASKILSAP